MTLYLDEIAPNFTQKSNIGEIDFYNYLSSSWGIITSHPADFTPICTTEMGTISNLANEFKQRNVKILGLSVDSAESHQKWIPDINKIYNCNLDFPIIADDDRKVSKLYGMIKEGSSDMKLQTTVRSMFIIDPNKKIRIITIYPMAVGRNFAEIIRSIDALQTADKHSVATPANWQIGDRLVVPASVNNDQEALANYKNVEAITTYLRYTDGKR